MTGRRPVRSGRSEKAALVSGSSSALLGRRRRVSVGWVAASRGWLPVPAGGCSAGCRHRLAGSRLLIGWLVRLRSSAGWCSRRRGRAGSPPGAVTSCSGPAAWPRRRAGSPSVRPLGRARSAGRRHKRRSQPPACPCRGPGCPVSCRPPGPGRPAGRRPTVSSPVTGAPTGGRFLPGESCWAVRAVVASGLSDARSSQNCSSLTPPNVSVGHSSSSRSAPLRNPTRRRGLAVLAATSPGPSLGSVVAGSPGVGSSGHESPGHESSGQESAASASPGHEVLRRCLPARSRRGRGRSGSAAAGEHLVEVEDGIGPGVGLGAGIPGRDRGRPERGGRPAAAGGPAGMAGQVGSGGTASASRAPVGPGAACSGGPKALIAAVA